MSQKWDKVSNVTRQSRHGRAIKRVLEWLTNSDISDTAMAAALALPKQTYQRRKEAEDFPSYEDLARLAEAFKVSARALQIEFGLRGEDELEWLEEDELRQYRALSDDAHPFSVLTRTRVDPAAPKAKKTRRGADLSEFQPRSDEPPL